METYLPMSKYRKFDGTAWPVRRIRVFPGTDVRGIAIRCYFVHGPRKRVRALYTLRLKSCQYITFSDPQGGSSRRFMMASDGASGDGWDKSQLREYFFPTTQLPRMRYTDPRVGDMISREVCNPQTFSQCWKSLHLHASWELLLLCCQPVTRVGVQSCMYTRSPVLLSFSG